MKIRIKFIFKVLFIILIGTTPFLYRNISRPKPINIILITIDALRPDHLGCYGYKRNTSPNIDRIAREGVLFTQAISQAGRTVPSLTSLITSNFLSVHHVFTENMILPPSIQTVTEILKAKDYNTAFISGHGSIFYGKNDGLNRAFDSSEDCMAQASQITQKAIEWIKSNKDKKFFLQLHYFDPHGPYTPPEPYRAKYLNDNLYRQNKNIPISIGNKTSEGDGEIPAYVAERGITDIDYYIAQYDGEISFTDEQVGVLLSTLKDLNMLRNTLIIITADHGEYLGEHNFYFMHGGLYDVIIKIPLIMKCEGVIPAKKVIHQQVSLIDIMPTILDFIKIKMNLRINGISLLPLIFNGRYNMPYSFSEFMNPQGISLVSIRTEDWKLIHNRIRNTYALFNLKEDPQELSNLIEMERTKLKLLKSELNRWIDSHRSSGPILIRQLDEKAKNRLISLGYAQ